MPSTRTASIRQIERSQRLAQRMADSAAGTLATETVSAGTMLINPADTNPDYWGGELWIYEADDATLLSNGLVQPTDLPKAAAGCKTKRRAGNDLIQTLRMKDGRVRLTISAHLVRARDAGFVDFLARTVGSALISGAMGKPTSE